MRNKGVDFDYREESIPINKVTNRSSYARFIVVGFSCESMTERKDGLRALHCFSFIFQINAKGVETMNAQQFIKRNGSTILTYLGGAGVIITAVAAVKATPKAMRLIEEAEKEKGEKLTKWETVKTAAVPYVPTILIGSATVACIFGANILNQKKQAALMSAYALLDRSYKDYKQKVKELYGEDSDQEIRSEIAKDRYEEEEFDDEFEDGKQLFYDEYSHRYFRATNEKVLQAQYEINKLLTTEGGASLNDYYNLLGVQITDYGDYVGWSAAQMYEMYWNAWLYFHYTRVDLEDGMECWIIDYTEPFAEFDEY